MKLSAVYVCFAACFAGAGQAAPVTVFWSGDVISIGAQAGSLDQGLGLFDRVDGTIVYDDADLVALVSDPDRVFTDAASISVTMTLGADSFAWSGVESFSAATPTFGASLNVDNTRDAAPAGSLLSINVFDNDVNDFLASDSAAPSGPVPITRNGVEMSKAAARFDLQISDSTPDLFGANFDVSAIDIADFDVSFFNLALQEDLRPVGGSGPGSNIVNARVRLDYWSVSGPRIDNMPTPVPAPASAGFVLAGLGAFAGLGCMKRAKRKRYA